MQAIRSYSEALVDSPSSVVLLANRSQALLQRNWLGDAEACLRECDRVLRADPRHSKSHVRRIQALQALKRFAAAARHAEAARDCLPDTAPVQRLVREVRREHEAALETAREQRAHCGGASIGDGGSGSDSDDTSDTSDAEELETDLRAARRLRLGLGAAATATTTTTTTATATPRAHCPPCPVPAGGGGKLTSGGLIGPPTPPPAGAGTDDRVPRAGTAGGGAGILGTAAESVGGAAARRRRRQREEVRAWGLSSTCYAGRFCGHANLKTDI